VLDFETLYSDNLPSAEMYEKSYMHRDVVTHVLFSKTHFLVTASCDGHVKFWKKQAEGVEFVKHFRSHLGPVSSLSVSADGLWCCSTSTDQTAKFYDVINFDMVNLMKLPYAPVSSEWLHKSHSPHPRIAIGDRDSPSIRIYDPNGKSEALATISIHHAPVHIIKFNEVYNAVISSDEKGIIEYWDAVDFGDARDVSFKFKTETDLYEFAKHKVRPLSLAVSPDGKRFVTWSKDRQVRVFTFATGKLIRKLDEGLHFYNELQKGDDAAYEKYKLESIDFGRRMAVEKELSATDGAPPSNVVFDETGHFICYATMLGIKMVNVETNRLVRILGKVENTERFLTIALYQDKPKSLSGYTMGSGKQALSSDPTLACTAFKKHRVYFFSRREPKDEEDENGVGRDVFNEKPSREQQVVLPSSGPTQLESNALLHTSLGDIHIKLFPKECPKTVENFTQHIRNGYYNGLILHRVIKGFMLQTGDPLGDGTGGTSIWGHDFEDEFHRALRHDRPFTVSMANAGPNTNGSQFFITTVACPWLDNKHTVFGRVHKGMDVVQAIERAKTDRNDKPLVEIKIINASVSS